MEDFNQSSNLSTFIESIQPVPSPSKNTDVDKERSSSLTWSDLHTAPPLYESPSLANVLDGSPSVPTPSSLSIGFGHRRTHDEQIPFRSPPSNLDSSSLMELQTVTPSRVGISPKTIIKKVDQDRKEEEVQNDIPQLSSIFMPQLLPPEPQRSNLSDVQVHGHAFPTSVKQRPCQTELRQFQIVIGGNSPDSSHGDLDVDETSNKQPSTSANRTINFAHDSDEEVDRRNVKDIQEDLNIDQDVLTESRKVATKGKSTKLPRELRGLMGEANLRYARGEHEDTIKMCMEVIRLAPYAAEPFETLAMIYEERGETKKALQYSLLAAHVSPTDAEQWLHLAQLCLQQNDQFKALNCFCKAYNADRSNVDVAIQCAEMYKEFGSCANALHKYKAAMNAMKDDEKAVQLARDVAKVFHEKRESSFSVDILEEAMMKHPKHFKDVDMNMLCELLLLCEKFGHILKALMKHSGIALRFEDEIENRNTDEDYSGLVGISIPSSLAVDLRCKLAVAMIRLKKSHLVEEMVQDICEHDPADIGDLQFDLAETFMDAKDYTKALAILDLLVASPHYGLAAVWLRHADCCQLCGQSEKALFSYRQCISLAPGHVQTYLVYSAVLRKMKRFDIAIQALDEAAGYECDGKLRMQLHIERFNVLKAWGETGRKDKISAAADEAILMFANRLKVPFIDGKLVLIRRRHTSRNPLAGDVMLLRRRVTSENDKVPQHTDCVASDGNSIVLNKEEWLKMFEVTMEMLVTCGRYRDAVNLGEGAQYLSVWNDHAAPRQLMEHLTFSTCMLGGNYHYAYNYIRVWILQHPEKSQLWNLFNQITARTEDQRHHRFCMRLVAKLPDHAVLGILNGHNWLATGSYRNAMNEYVRAHKKLPNDSLLVMLIGIVFIHIACQKFSEQKNSLIVQGLAFLHKYMRMRDLPQESYYNVGRALHQLGLEHFAIHYYERALDCPPPVVKNPVVDGSKVAPPSDASIFDLRCEIAHNLSLIYRRSGNHVMANKVLMEHCVI
uniref:General transcription factor 3C polypeptide 3-like n=1 Tax=Phallusia mammillata TaxID=59560 RepID=A0A6F9DF20_9ASCI|nr:general transcription factor 3C polypeptide 3-like [Phallusia mammillata]